jgi:hypothetical protein
MLNEISNQIVPILVTAIVAILTVIIKIVADKIIDFISTKKKAVEQQIGIEKAKDIEDKAFKVWKEVDEYFRISNFVGDAVAAKQKKFEEFMLKKVPSLTGEEIADLRQVVAGEINKDKAKIISSNAVQIDSNQLQVLQDKANKFDQLQNALSQGNPVPESPQTAQKTN